jgi:uncharacterized YigZ family protein
MPEDTYNTIKTNATGLYKEKGSKFLAFAEPVSSEDEARSILEKYRKEYHDARHHCFAWAIGPSRELQRMNDDGEPSGTAGKPIFGQILSFNLTNLIIVVVRYFGGTKLGVGGLVTAYKTAARNALESAIIITKTVNEAFEIVFDYSDTTDVMRLIKEHGCSIVKSSYTDKCYLIAEVRKNKANFAFDGLAALNNVNIKHLKSS